MNQVNDGKIFDGRIEELFRCSEYEIKCSKFLTPSEQQRAYSIAVSSGNGGRCFFWGGAFDAERRKLAALPEWMIPDYSLQGGAFDTKREELIHEIISNGADDGFIMSDIVPVRINTSGFTEIDHRDYLGALLALGLDRSALGDIAVADSSHAIVFASKAAAKLIVSELESVGRESVKAFETELPSEFRVPYEFEFLYETVMSVRLDGFVKAVTKLSRDGSAELVTQGDVSVNYLKETKTDKSLEPGDVISVRGYGKFIYDSNGGLNRRGRIKLKIRKFV